MTASTLAFTFSKEELLLVADALTKQAYTLLDTCPCPKSFQKKAAMLFLLANKANEQAAIL